MTNPDPIFAAIERHRLADAAYDDSIERQADESVKDARGDKEKEVLLDVLRTKPETVAGCVAALRHIADWAESNDAALSSGWYSPH